MTNVTISIAQAANLLGVSQPTMYQLARRADFPAFRVGKRLLVDVAGLETWVHKQSGQGGNV